MTAVFAPGSPRGARAMETAAVKGRSLLSDARRCLFRNKAAVVSMVLLGIIAVMALFAPYLSPYAFSDQDYSVVSCAPSWWPGSDVRCRAGGAHWLASWSPLWFSVFHSKCMIHW